MVDGTTERRPRVIGEREDEILDATLTLLADVGYDRLTMDAVAGAARAGKATLYRRWRSKGELVVDALHRAQRCTRSERPDTGSLRGDLLAGACGVGGTTEIPVALIASLLTAMHHDQDLRRAFEQRVVQPQLRAARDVLRRAAKRGEVSPGVDPELLLDIVPSMVMHRLLVRGEPPTPGLIARIIDEVVLPAARRTCAGTPVEAATPAQPATTTAPAH